VDHFDSSVDGIVLSAIVGLDPPADRAAVAKPRRARDTPAFAACCGCPAQIAVLTD
jgi:hypothetical protein